MAPTSGQARIFGRPAGEAEARRRVGYLPENFRFHDWMTGAALLEFHARLAGMDAATRRKRIPEVLGLVGLTGRGNDRIRASKQKRPEQTIPKSLGHHNEWMEAIRTGKPALCAFEYAGPLAETVLLGNVAYRSGKKLDWDAASLKAKNCPEAEQFLKREYRKGWTL